MKRGDFDDSVLRSVDKLKDNPSHSSSIEILRQAYPSALDQHLEEITHIFRAKSGNFLRTNNVLNKFVRFYSPEEALDIKLRPDHTVTLQFDDFVVGQTLVEKNTETVTSKDSAKIGEKVVGISETLIYDKVTAKFTKSRKTIHSAGLLDMQIRDYKTKRLVNQEKFNDEYNRMSEWTHFNGDERALTPAQLRMTKSHELLPPAPQQLFVEFSKSIYDRLTARLRSFYEKY